jgi:adenylylsulfate kinase
MQKNIVQHKYQVTVDDRRKLNDHNSFLIWITGLSGSGKSTVANAIEAELYKKGVHTYVLDGDNIRTGINKNLTFSPNDRHENIRRIGEIAKLFIDAGTVVIAAFISPYKVDRQQVKELVGAKNYVEVFVNTPLAICEKRDVKGLYKKARAGEIKEFTGVSAPYENPEKPDFSIDTDSQNYNNKLMDCLKMISSKL